MKTSALFVGLWVAAHGATAFAADKQTATPQSQASAVPAEGASPEARARAREILRQMLPPQMSAGMTTDRPADGFGKEMSRIAFENAFVQLWARPGLSVKERSMITIPMLIALGSERELRIHLAAGLRNGLTVEQLEEIIYHSSAYVGFPRASTALALATEVVAEQQKENASGKDAQ